MSKAQKIKKELENFLTDQQIVLEYGSGGFYGGGCLVHRESRIVVNKNIPVEEQITILARSILELNLNIAQLKPVTLAFIHEYLAAKTA